MNNNSPASLYQFCTVCGSEAVNDGLSVKCSSSDCGKKIYMNPSPSVQAFVINEDNEVLLVKRAIEPMKDKFDLPGGFVDNAESFEAGLIRELTEEIGIITELELKYLCSLPDKYMYSGVDLNVLVVTYVVKITRKQIQIADQREISELLWVPITELSAEQLAFENTKHAYELLIKNIDTLK